MSAGRSILVTILLLFLSTPSIAAQELKGGVKLGLNNSWVGENWMSVTGADTDPRRTLLAGLFLVIPISDRLALQPELTFTRKGERAEFEDRGFRRLDGGEEVLELDYIEVPLLLSARTLLFASERVTSRIFAGPYAAYNIGCAYVFGTFEASCNTPESALDLVDGDNWDYGAVIGAGIAREFSSGTAGLDIRYTHGLTAVAHGNGGENRVVSISAGYAIPLGS